MMKEYLAALRQSEEFQNLIIKLKEDRPIVPAYTYSADNTEEWKALSNQLQGFNLCLTLLGETDA